MIFDFIQEHAAAITLFAVIGVAVVGAILFDPNDGTWGK